ncbi:hypothetical protein PAAG_12646 [Paracoccidioides lutzii Pb01]|uniref:Uncharacterized protein n=1 Tax=Paracoccidioides lutzii (strain ATCC MYA-826 / Pb01) TaxID=502779 RepID=A0A0A2V3K1_PARBA|nr:hypothetical protein PAAG_12646 [Paracoccidioides lutzii Pb01]KGQ00690.1 hypothetical protein PAAG_12646 [Paracoccidioides lutzii Pb01]
MITLSRQSCCSSKQKCYQQHVISQLVSDDGSDEDKYMNIETLPRITASEALNLVKRVRLYEEQQDQGDQSLIQQLNYYERRLGARKLENQQHLHIADSFI